MTDQDLKDEGAIELGCEVLEGLYEIIDISPSEDQKVLHRVAFMLESFLEYDYNVSFENKTEYNARRLDS